MYMALLGRNVDAAFYDAPNVAYFSQTRGEGRTKVVGPLYEGQQYGIVFHKGSEWVEPTNQALAEMREDGPTMKSTKSGSVQLPLATNSNPKDTRKLFA